MPFPDSAFVHTPELRGLITPPDQSEMRFGMDRFAELDVQAVQEGWPPGWRMDHDLREANRQHILSDRFGSDLWVFAYGSLIWDPALQVAEYRRAVLPGWHRSFCMRLEGGRGSHERPGLMAALEEGGTCQGLAFRLEGALVDQETAFLWNREMFAGAYAPIFQTVDTPQGPVEALTFVMAQDNPRYMPQLPADQAAAMIAHAEGLLGTNFDYLERLVTHLDALGIRDDAMHHLLQLTKAQRS